MSWARRAARGAAAINLLRQILNQWQPRPIETIKRIVVGSHDTPIEMRLRALLLRWAKSKGAAVSIQATSHGDSAKITFPQSLRDLQWALVPQVKLGGVQPDFVLTCADQEVPQIAVFCDSQLRPSELPRRGCGQPSWPARPRLPRLGRDPP